MIPLLPAPQVLDLSFLGGLPSSVAFTRASSGWSLNSAGVLVQAAANVPRIEYSAVGVPLGLLIEPQPTNLALYSVGNGAAWSFINSLVATATSGTAPDGSNTATLLTTSSTSNAYAQPITVVASTAYIFSYWCKTGTMNSLYNSVYDLTHSAEIIAPVSFYAQVNGTTWTRVFMSFTTPVGCTSINIYPIRNTLSIGTVYIWGAQLEASIFATSYIATTSSATTRAADVAIQSIFPGMVGVSAFSVAVEFDLLSNSQAVAIPLGLSGGGGFANTLYLGQASAGSLCWTDIVASVGVTGGSGTLGAVGTVQKTAVSLTTAGAAAAMNGAALTTAVNAGYPAMTTIGIGCSPWASDHQFAGHIRRIRLWPRALNAAELLQVTT